MTIPELNTIYCMDCFDMLNAMPDDCIDSIILDPPYGIGIDVWDIAIDIPRLLTECKRVLKDTGFISVFGIMPTILNWVNCLHGLFIYKDHVTWVKRRLSAVALDMPRSKEELFIYRMQDSQYHQTRGKYEDVKYVELGLSRLQEPHQIDMFKG